MGYFQKLYTYGDVWVLSDSHYHHKNICRGTTSWRNEDGSVPTHNTRDFNTIEEMNQTIVNNINAVVKPDDTLFMLGDIVFSGSDKVMKFIDQINCKFLHLVFGNHDKHFKRNVDNCLSRFISSQDILEANIEGYDVVMSHFPIASWNKLGKGSIHLYGHLHSKGEDRFINHRSMDVGMDGNDLKPYHFLRDIVPVMMNKEPGTILSNYMYDHHVDE